MTESHFNHLLWYRFGLPTPGSCHTDHPAIDRAMDEATLFSIRTLQPLIKAVRNILNPGLFRHACFKFPTIQCLQSEQTPLPVEICKGLVEEPPVTRPSLPPPTSESDSFTSTTCPVLVGYPDYPLYKRLADSTANWMVTG